MKKMYEKQLNRLQSMTQSIKSKDANVHRLIELNKELEQCERMKNEYLTQLQQLQSQSEQQEEEFKINNNGTHNHNHIQKQHRLLMQQSEEIQELKDMLAAAVSELKRHNPDNTKVDDLVLKGGKRGKDSNVFTYGQDGIVAHEDILKVKQLCDDEINRYKQLYDDMDRDYQAFKTKTNKEI